MSSALPRPTPIAPAATPAAVPVQPGALVDGWRIGELLHEGGTGWIYWVTPEGRVDPGFRTIMKVPPLGPGHPAIGIISFEMEQTILPNLRGPYVPRYVASGDVVACPYIVMEWIEGQSLADRAAEFPLPLAAAVQLAACIADAVHAVHQQEVIHCDLKPDNVLVRPSGEVALIDFGFARHARYPDLLAEERDFAAGSAAYVSPEQLQGDRSDLRSDIFALGVLLYEMATGEKPFGEPRSIAGMRDRIWRPPEPPRSLRQELPPALQEIILRCLEPDAAARYQSAAHVALDLRHPEAVRLTKRAELITQVNLAQQVARWWRARTNLGKHDGVRAELAPRAPVIMVALHTEHADDVRHAMLQATVAGILAISNEYRLMCVSVISAPPLGAGTDPQDTTTGKHLEHKARLRTWVEPLRLPPGRISLHVIESANPADTLLELARSNHVDLIVLGAPGPAQRALAWWRSVASTVSANAHCSVHLVRVAERHDAHGV